MADSATVGRYRKNPVEIDAVHFENPEQAETIADWSGAQVVYIGEGADKRPDHLVVPTTEGPMQAPVGWWIIKGLEGEFYPCKDSVFQASYQPV